MTNTTKFFTFTSVLEKLDSNVWSHHFEVPDEVVRYFANAKDKRVVCTINQKTEFQCALMPKGEGVYFINVNKKIRDELALKLGDSLEVSIRKDESEYGLPMPAELEELLGMDNEVNTFFHALTPGKQRNLLYIVGSPKQANTRIRRAIAVVNHLKSNNGKLDFKMLNQTIKNTI